MIDWLKFAIAAVCLAWAPVAAAQPETETTVGQIIIDIKVKTPAATEPATAPTSVESAGPKIPGGSSLGGGRPPPTAPKPVQTAPMTPLPNACPSVCKGGLTTVFKPGEKGCEVNFTIPCYPGACAKDGKVCASACATGKDCADGATCGQNGTCVPNVNSCSDFTTVRGADGSLRSCLPYSCLSGQCNLMCVGDADCGSGFKCNSDTLRCVRKK